MKLQRDRQQKPADSQKTARDRAPPVLEVLEQSNHSCALDKDEHRTPTTLRMTPNFNVAELKVNLARMRTGLNKLHLFTRITFFIVLLFWLVSLVLPWFPAWGALAPDQISLFKGEEHLGSGKLLGDEADIHRSVSS